MSFASAALGIGPIDLKTLEGRIAMSKACCPYGTSSNDSYARSAVLGIRDTYNYYGFAANINLLEWLRPSRTMEDYIRDELKII